MPGILKWTLWLRPSVGLGWLLFAGVPALSGCLPTAQAAQYSKLSHSPAGLSLGRWGDLSGNPFEENHPLTRKELLEAVLERNPSIESARQAWRAALARYPQATAWDDPTLTYQTAPGTLGSKHGYGQVVQIGQPIPWPGKRELRGAIALAQAEAVETNLERVRLHLAQTASLLFDDYYVVHRALDINQEHVALVQRLRMSAEAQYSAGRGSQQDPLQADVELALLEQEHLSLRARQEIIAAQINGLLHRPAISTLPNPPNSLAQDDEAPDDAPTTPPSDLIHQATSFRPEARAASHRVDGALAALSLAKKASLPDLKVMGTYNSMWPQLEHQFMISLSLNLPLMFGRLRAGVEEATAHLSQTEAERLVTFDRVQVEVRKAQIQLKEAVAQSALYRTRILPAARNQVSAAEGEYQNGRNSFAALIGAERRLRTFKLQYEESQADIWRRRAGLARALGVVPPSFEKEGGLQ